MSTGAWDIEINIIQCWRPENRVFENILAVYRKLVRTNLEQVVDDLRARRAGSVLETTVSLVEYARRSHKFSVKFP